MKERPEKNLKNEQNSNALLSASRLQDWIHLYFYSSMVPHTPELLSLPGYLDVGGAVVLVKELYNKSWGKSCHCDSEQA